MKINSVRNVFKYFLHGAQGHFLFMLVTGPKDSMWDWFRYTLQVFTRFCLDTSIVFAIITGNLITRSDTAISTNFVQSKTIQESLKHFFIIFMQQDNVFTKTENCHSAHICPQCRALSLVHQASSTMLFLVLELVFRFAISSHLSRWNIFYTTLPYV